MESKKIFFYSVFGMSLVLSFFIGSDYRTKSLLLQKYQHSEESVRLLKNAETFRLYLTAHKKEPLISPTDFSLALKDLNGRDEKGLDFIVSLARIRRLLGASYPTDFAIALARLEKSLPSPETGNDFPHSFRNEKEKELIKDAASLAILAYSPPSQAKSEKYAVVASASAENGFSATAFKDKEDHLIIAFRGSDEIKDLDDAQKMLDGQMPAQFENALAFYQKLRKQYPDARICATGHSLGGSLAQLLAAHTGDVLALTCNPVGTKRLIKHDFDAGKIMNLTVQNDKFSFALPQAGHNIVLKPNKTDAYGDPLHPHSVLNCYQP